MDETDGLTAEERRILARHSPGSEHPARLAADVALPEELPMPRRVNLKCTAVWVGLMAPPTVVFWLIMLLNPFNAQPEWPYDADSVVKQVLAQAVLVTSATAIAFMIVAYIITGKLRTAVRKPATEAFATNWFEVIDVLEDDEGVSILVLINPVAQTFEWAPVKFRLRRCSWLCGSDAIVREGILRLEAAARLAALERLLEGNVLEVQFPDGCYTAGRNQLYWGTAPVFRLTPQTTPDRVTEELDALDRDS